MRTPTTTFLKSCAALGDLPADSVVPEIALLGRSNVGKSSLLNCLTGQHQLAKTSRTPGRTRLLNFFSVNDGHLYLVDCPGYGYAKVARDTRTEWGEFIHPYLQHRPQLAMVLLLVDSMLPAQTMDLELHDWLMRHQLPTQLVATKWDRLSGNGKPQAKRRLEREFNDTPLGFSSVTGEGRDQLWHRIFTAADSAVAATSASASQE